jgi:hypothetical protein
MASNFSFEELESRRFLSHTLDLGIAQADGSANSVEQAAAIPTGQATLSIGLDDEDDDGDVGWSVGARGSARSVGPASLQTEVAASIARLQTDLAKAKASVAGEESARMALLIASATAAVAMSTLNREQPAEQAKTEEEAAQPPSNLGLFLG